MKNILAAALLLFSTAATYQHTAQAQVRVNVNIGTPVAQSPWYSTDDDYYYLPEQGVYYNVNRRVYVYQDNNQWMYAQNLPSRYNGLTWKKSHYVRVRDRSPFNYHNSYSKKYGRNYNGGHVTYRRDMDGRTNNGRGNNGHDNGNHNGRGRH
jgi:hypothetical protein